MNKSWSIFFLNKFLSHPIILFNNRTGRVSGWNWSFFEARICLSPQVYNMTGCSLCILTVTDWFPYSFFIDINFHSLLIQFVFNLVSSLFLLLFNFKKLYKLLLFIFISVFVLIFYIFPLFSYSLWLYLFLLCLVQNSKMTIWPVWIVTARAAGMHYLVQASQKKSRRRKISWWQ